MKSIVVLLTFSLVLHLQCGGSCLADSAEVKADQTTSEPPCHQHAESSSKRSQVPSHAPAHDDSSPCSQGQVTEFKSSVAGKVALPLAAIMPNTIENLTAHRPLIVRLSPEKAPHLADPPTLFSVLRI